MSQTIDYEIVALDLDTHEFVLRMTLPGRVAHGQLLQLPAWIPGSYMIRDFARNITAIAARDPAGDVGLQKHDKQTWAFARAADSPVVDYRVYAFDLSVRGAYLDRTRAYFNGTCLFLSLSGQREAGWTLRIHRPPNASGCADWRVATTLPASAVDERGFGLYAGHGYPRLIDHPVEIGVQRHGRFSVAGVPHDLYVTDGGCYDIERLCRDLQPVCAEHVALFGELPVERYAFLTLATGDGYGGLEHADSTSLICKRSDLPAPGLDRPDKGYRQFLGLCSHEYFHLWNVKRIRPQRLAEADLSGETHTELLWAFEGITSYYDELALARAGVLAAKDYLDLFATTVTRVLRTPGRSRQSIAESSFDAWTRFYKQDENAPNAIVSYYAKGALVAFGLDVTLRQRSRDRLSLDDLMRRLWQRHGQSGEGVAERAIEREVEGLLGEPLDDFFAGYVYGTDELPLDDWFGGLGIGWRTRVALNAEDLGGYRTDAQDRESPPGLGARIEAEPVGLRLTQVIAGGPAQAAGLAPGDLLVAIGGERVTAGNLAELLKRHRAAPVEVHHFRRDLLQAATLEIGATPTDTCELWLLDDDALDDGVRARRDAWLRANRPQGA